MWEVLKGETKKPQTNFAWGLLLTDQDLYLANVSRLRSFWPLFNFKLNLVPLIQGFITVTDNGFVMYKNIVAFFSDDKTITLGVVEPLNRTSFHGNKTLYLNYYYVQHILISCAQKKIALTGSNNHSQR